MSLQKDLRDGDPQTLAAHPEIRHFGEQQQGFSDAAALCDLMDVVITTDTAVAHLAGALGKPTWLLLAYAPDWRWLLHRDDSPWYPSMKLYRQPSPGDWPSVITRVAQDLQALPR